MNTCITGKTILPWIR